MDRSTTRPFSVEEQRFSDRRALVSVRGAVNLFSAPTLKRVLVTAIDNGAHEVVLDLTDTAFLDSTGLGALLAAHRRLANREGRLVIVGAQANVLRVLEVTGLDSIFQFASSREAALADVAPAPSGPSGESASA